MTPQVEMLLQCVALMEEGGKYAVDEAFSRLVDWIAVQAHVPSGHSEIGIVTPAVRVETAEKLDRTLDIALLKLQPADHLRAAAVELGLLDPPPKYVEVELTGVRTWPAWLVTAAGSGTRLLELFLEYGKQFLYYGVIDDELEYHMALVTMHLYDVPARILRADPVHGTRIDSPNWEYANLWYPPAPSRLSRS